MTCGDQLKLMMEANEGLFCRENVLTSVTAGSVDILRGLAHHAAGTDPPAARPPHFFSSNSRSDKSMLSMMPALASLEIGDSPFFATFKGTVHGSLSLATAKTLRKASLVHCTGISSQESLQYIKAIPSIKSWSSFTAVASDTTLIERLAPQLETLHLNIVGSGADAFSVPTDVWLTPVMKHVDVTLCHPGQPLRLRGKLASSLTYMLVEAHGLHVSKALYDWVLARHPLQTGLHGTQSVVGGVVYWTAVNTSPIILRC